MYQSGQIWRELELDKLFNIHRIELLNKKSLNSKVSNSDFILTEDVYNEVKKCYNSSNLEDNYSYIDSLLTAVTWKLTFKRTKIIKDAVNLLEVIEDTVQYFCDENKVSGEKVWHMINSLSEVKCGYFPYDNDYEEEELED